MILFVRLLRESRHVVVASGRRWRLRYGSRWLGEDELNVAWAAQVRANTAMRSVSSPTHLRRLIHLDMHDLKCFGVELLHSCVGLSVSQQAEQVLAALLRPTNLAAGVVLEIFALRLPPDAGNETTKWDGLFVREHVIQVLLRIFQRPAFQRHSGLACVLEMHL